MDYYDSAEDLVITQDRALQELARHGITSNEDILEFFADVGEQEEYDAQKVLIWLGYWLPIFYAGSKYAKLLAQASPRKKNF